MEIVTENPTMAMAMASTYTRWKRLVSGLAGGSSLKSQGDFHPSAVTSGGKHTEWSRTGESAPSAHKDTSDRVLVGSSVATRRALPLPTFFPGPCCSDFLRAGLSV